MQLEGLVDKAVAAQMRRELAAALQQVACLTGTPAANARPANLYGFGPPLSVQFQDSQPTDPVITT